MICCLSSVKYLHLILTPSLLKVAELLFVDPVRPRQCIFAHYQWSSSGKDTQPGNLSWPQVCSHICPATVCVGMFGWAPYVTGCLRWRPQSTRQPSLNTIYKAALLFGCMLGIVGINWWRDECSLSCFRFISLWFFPHWKTMDNSHLLWTVAPT